MMEHCCKNNERLKAIDYFHLKKSIIDFSLDVKYNFELRITLNPKKSLVARE